MEEQLKILERVSLVLEPDADQRQVLKDHILSLTDTFLSDLEEGPAYYSDNSKVKQGLVGNFSENGEESYNVIKNAREHVDFTGINPASGKHLGYVPGGGLFISSLADYWAAITNRFAGVFFANPGAVRMENEVIRWACQLVGYPDSAWGNLSSGGSIANLTAIIAARENKGITPDNVRNAVIYLSDQTHHCVDKALRISGLHHCQMRRVPLDEGLRMQPYALQELIEKDVTNGLKPFLLVTSAGTTDSGVIDPIEDLDRIAKKFKVWHHIDAAYGGFFLLTETLQDKLNAISQSDSVVMDPHKSLFLPYGIGIVVVKDRNHLTTAFQQDANYMQDVLDDEEELSPADVSPELTKHFRGLRIWLPLKIHGLKAFRSSLEEKHLLSKYFAREIQKIEGFEIYQEPEISVVMFRYINTEEDLDEFNKRLVGTIHEDGRVFISTTTVNGVFWLRVAILVFRTHKKTVDLFLGILREKVIQLKSDHHWASPN